MISEVEVISKETINKAVVASLVEVLNIDANAISSDSKLISDLGVESIDFLDIGYELEKHIGTEISFATITNDLNDESELTVELLVNYILKEIG